MKPDLKTKFEEVCRDNADALFRYCYFKVSDRELAKDLVQEAYFRTWNCLGKGEKIDNIRAFLYKVLNNLVIDEYRKKKAISLEQMAENGFDPAFNDRESIEDKIDGKMAVEMLQFIPESYQEVIFMRYVEDMSLKEISEIVGETENAISVRVHRGLKKIKEMFAQNFNNNG